MSDFAQRLIAWQRGHGRHDLPWQNTRDPYRVWLSEIMLQQTQVDTVIPYYQRFLERFSTLAELAAAPQGAVLALWSGLGYYARARNLHRAAQLIVSDYGGQFPSRAEEIAELPGIGRSTAAAIAAFCFGEHVAILDGNVKRVLARYCAIEGYPGLRAVEQALWAQAQALLPANDIATYTQALMDLGATVCTRSQPVCTDCPVRSGCQAERDGRQDELPTPRPTKALPTRSTQVLIACQGGAVLLEQRPQRGIWGGLWSLPEIPEGEAPERFARALGLRPQSGGVSLPEIRHSFTHFRLTITPWRCVVDDAAPQGSAACWATPAQWAALGLPAPIRRLLEALTPGP